MCVYTYTYIYIYICNTCERATQASSYVCLLAVYYMQRTRSLTIYDISKYQNVKIPYVTNAPHVVHKVKKHPM